LLFIGAQMFARMLTLSGLVTEISQFMATLNVPPLLVVAGMMLILMILGTFLDIISIMLITMPIFLPVIDVLGFDLIWFGVMATISIETGMLTPPFGMVVFVVKSTLGDLVSLEDIYIGSLPFLLTLFLTIAILLFFPKISTWLPSFL
ncbi:MAG: TRAP transporter large permease subunit, partial [Bacteroidetes bacterium]|nr:TRAP transporter large permease subunit [Bacteroidota bacterium]